MSSSTKPSARAHHHPNDTRCVNLALQGGGSHGAFSWGVLDSLLSDGRLHIEGISGTSAGAMNAVVLAHGLVKARDQGLNDAEQNKSARTALQRFWDGVGLVGTFMSGLPIPLGAQALMNWWTQWISPAQANPLGWNPLLRLLNREVDFSLLAQSSKKADGVKVFVSATNIRTGRGEVFSGDDLTADAVMASACLPGLFKAVEIKGEYYWDGGYSGNPAIWPLIYGTTTSDVILVQLNPIESPFDPSASAQDISNRVNEITFNASLLAEMRAIEFVRRLLEERRVDPTRYKSILLHRVDGGSALAEFGAASKIRADMAFLTRLFNIGHHAGKIWLTRHYEDLAVRSSVESITKEVFPSSQEEDHP